MKGIQTNKCYFNIWGKTATSGNFFAARLEFQVNCSDKFTLVSAITLAKLNALIHSEFFSANEQLNAVDFSRKSIKYLLRVVRLTSRPAILVASPEIRLAHLVRFFCKIFFEIRWLALPSTCFLQLLCSLPIFVFLINQSREF